MHVVFSVHGKLKLSGVKEKNMEKTTWTLTLLQTVMVKMSITETNTDKAFYAFTRFFTTQKSHGKQIKHI